MNGQFQLDRVLDPQFTMPHGPELEQVAILAIALLPITYSQMVTINFLADIPLTTAELHQRIQEHLSLPYLRVHRLFLEFCFIEDYLASKPQPIRCELTTPDQHNLTDAPRHQHILQYLHSWGLYDGYPNARPNRSAEAE